MEQLIAGNPSGVEFTHISVGTSGTAESAGDTALTNAVDCPIILVEYLPNNIVRFTADLDASVPDMVIAEMGLKNSAGALMYRKVKSPTFSHALGLTNTLKYSIKIV